MREGQTEKSNIDFLRAMWEITDRQTEKGRRYLLLRLSPFS